MAVSPPIIPDKIIANQMLPSADKKSISYTPYQVQMECNLCCTSLCKGDALEKYMKTAGPFDTVYFGNFFQLSSNTKS